MLAALRQRSASSQFLERLRGRLGHGVNGQRVARAAFVNGEVEAFRSRRGNEADRSNGAGSRLLTSAATCGLKPGREFPPVGIQHGQLRVGQGRRALGVHETHAASVRQHFRMQSAAHGQEEVER